MINHTRTIFPAARRPVVGLALLGFLAMSVEAQADNTDDDAARGRAMQAQAACGWRLDYALPKAVTATLGDPQECDVSLEIVGYGGEGAPYPFAETVLLDWDQATVIVTTQYRERGLFQVEWTLEADPGSPLDAEWFGATRAQFLPEISDWSAFDAETTPNEDGVIEFQFPDSETYRGPIVDRYPDGSIRLIDIVGGSF